MKRGKKRRNTYSGLESPRGWVHARDCARDWRKQQKHFQTGPSGAVPGRCGPVEGWGVLLLCHHTGTLRGAFKGQGMEDRLEQSGTMGAKWPLPCPSCTLPLPPISAEDGLHGNAHRASEFARVLCALLRMCQKDSPARKIC